MLVNARRSPATQAPHPCRLATLAALPSRVVVAILAALILSAAAGFTPRPAYAYNCVNVVLRDPYWSQYRNVTQSGVNAAGMGTAFARQGFAVSGSPSVGAIMVWPAGYAGASGFGHVGVVAAVYANGTVLVRHENWPYGTAEHPQVFTVRPGHQFVHRIVAFPETDGTAHDTDSAQASTDGADSEAADVVPTEAADVAPTEAQEADLTVTAEL